MLRAARASLGPPRLVARALSTGTPEVTPSRVRRALRIKPDRAVDPARADPQVTQLHREMTRRHKWAVRNHTKAAEAREAAAAALEDDDRADTITESRRLHVDRLQIARAGDHIEVELLLTGIVEEPDKVDSNERVFKKRSYPDVGFSPTMLGNTRSLESDGFLDTVRRCMRARMPRRF